MTHVDTNDMSKIFENKKKDLTIKVNTTNKIYTDMYVKSKLLSVDMIQANATVFFVYFGKKLFMDNGLHIKDMGLGLEKYFDTWDDYLNRFNWSYYVKAQLTSESIRCVVTMESFALIQQAFTMSKVAREIILGVMAQKKLANGHTMETMLDKTCRTILCEFIGTIEPLINKSGAKVISFTMDELTMQGLDIQELLAFLNRNPSVETGFVHRYLRIEEFVLDQHKLSTGKKFYVKRYTDGAIPSIKYINPDKRCEAIAIVNKIYT